MPYLSLCNWNAAYLLNLNISNLYCIALNSTPYENHICQHPIPTHNALAANHLLEILPHLSIWHQEPRRRLLELAHLLLCRHFHEKQSQAQDMADGRREMISEEMQTRIHINDEEPLQMSHISLGLMTYQAADDSPQLRFTRLSRIVDVERDARRPSHLETLQQPRRDVSQHFQFTRENSELEQARQRIDARYEHWLKMQQKSGPQDQHTLNPQQKDCSKISGMKREVVAGGRPSSQSLRRQEVQYPLPRQMLLKSPVSERDNDDDVVLKKCIKLMLEAILLLLGSIRK